ncbi:hypothetical protein Y1Q_0015841 [Alligator mississippiensis]|uniref:Uncharacterized protein n=1 Tax=Alligator mississippiensis TaxID=8496 RepID=A0A151MH50_ALLMI|nr:hypothetical protein Y1Q_0015841 [Alligator mississippiensis]
MIKLLAQSGKYLLPPFVSLFLVLLFLLEHFSFGFILFLHTWSGNCPPSFMEVLSYRFHQVVDFLLYRAIKIQTLILSSYLLGGEGIHSDIAARTLIRVLP